MKVFEVLANQKKLIGMQIEVEGFMLASEIFYLPSSGKESIIKIHVSPNEDSVNNLYESILIEEPELLMKQLYASVPEYCGGVAYQDSVSIIGTLHKSTVQEYPLVLKDLVSLTVKRDYLGYYTALRAVMRYSSNNEQTNFLNVSD
ncbi:hypothetical protein PJF56_18955 [Roseofilum sp. BLCC_M91]|uniref:Uncharacterized protein n=1 Tax=Roseofilum halophilum BLCC-M91 TaxID=3022259 RepID=A0ABT7BP40_9CYAN|nr:hypothetical protein [Roseofilum halophilum]MDJ1180942.1 hypothetical protein [Roseofilum halophilum BLCC-M91]